MTSPASAVTRSFATEINYRSIGQTRSLHEGRRVDPFHRGGHELVTSHSFRWLSHGSTSLAEPESPARARHPRSGDLFSLLAGGWGSFLVPASDLLGRRTPALALTVFPLVYSCCYSILLYELIHLRTTRILGSCIQERSVDSRSSCNPPAFLVLVESLISDLSLIRRFQAQALPFLHQPILPGPILPVTTGSCSLSLG